MTKIILDVVDAEVQKIQDQLKALGLSSSVEKSDPLIESPKESLAVLFWERNEVKEENLYVQGDQSEVLSGKTVSLGNRSHPVIAAIYETDKNRTRVIFPIGSDASNLTNNEIKYSI